MPQLLVAESVSCISLGVRSRTQLSTLPTLGQITAEMTACSKIERFSAITVPEHHQKVAQFRRRGDQI
jgi:hypothetical protein